MDIYVCVGSSCHLKNSKAVIDKLNSRIKRENLEGKIALKGAFCMGECSNQGVSVRVDNKVYSVTEQNADEFFDKNILGAG